MAAASDLQPSAVEPIAALRGLDAAVRSATGDEAFPEALWRAIERDSEHCSLVVGSDGDVGVARFPSDTFAPSRPQLTVGLLPSAKTIDIERAVATALVGVAEELSVIAWVPGSDARIVTALHDRGFVVDREQHQMRVNLPLSEHAQWPDSIAVRAFVPGDDEADWLITNNRAFANHPDQGGWIAETMQRRMTEEWFDPAGFLLAWRGPDLVGFCWTKVAHVPSSERTSHQGEIFVIGVDPDAQGLGLGRALVLAGLEYLAEVRGCRTGVLYVAADNTAAVSLYRGLGFTVHRTDTALVLVGRTAR